MSTKAGFSIGIENLLIPKEKRWSARLTEMKAKKNEIYEKLGAITILESDQRILSRFTSISDSLKNSLLEIFQNEDSLNALYLIIFSGARGNLTQIRQLIGIRGLIVNPIGQVIKSPILSNFKEGISLTEFLLSCYGARKGIVDTALRTASAGYLTRRLVDVSHFQVISMQDCNTRRGIRLFPLTRNDGKVLVTFKQRRYGRSLSYPIPRTGYRNLFLNKQVRHQIRQKYQHTLFRSSLLCRAPFLSAIRQLSVNTYGDKKAYFQVNKLVNRKFQKECRYFTLCQHCYGWSLADGEIVHMGETVGILAAQSIGEPGTQLTMRTFHTGGVFSGGTFDILRSSINGKVFFPKMISGRIARSRTGKIGLLTRESGSILLKSHPNKRYKRKINKHKICTLLLRIGTKYYKTKNLCIEREIRFPKNILLLIRQGEVVTTNSRIALIDTRKHLHTREAQIRTYRTPNSGELFFEHVTLKKICSFVELEQFEKIEPWKFWLSLSLEAFQKIRTIGLARLILKAAEPLGINKNFPNPFLFNWKRGDYIRRNATLTKIRIIKPSYYPIVVQFKKVKLMIGCWQSLLHGSRAFFNDKIYFFYSSNRNYRILISQTTTFPTITYFLVDYGKNIFFSDLLRIEDNLTKKNPSLKLRKQKNHNITIITLSTFSTLDSFLRKFYRIRRTWTYSKISIRQLFFINRRALKKKKSFFVVFTKYIRNSNLYNIFLQDAVKRKISQICRQLQLPRLHFPAFQIFNYGNQKTFVGGFLLFCNEPSLRKKSGFLCNKQELSWIKIKIVALFYLFRTTQSKYSPNLNLKKNISFSFRRNSCLGTVGLILQLSRRILLLKFFGNVKERQYENHYWAIQRIQRQWKHTSSASKNVALLNFLTTNAAEIHQTRTSKEFFLLTKAQVKRYVHSLGVRPFFLGKWKRAPTHVTGEAGPCEIGQRISLDRNLVLLRYGCRILLENDSILPWNSESILPSHRPLTATHGRVTKTGDITSGIPQIEALLEIRMQTGISIFLDTLYKKFLEKGCFNGVARRKASHFRLRVIVDRVQRIYQANGVTIDDKHLEVLVRPIAFAQVIQDNAQEYSLIQGEKHPLDMMERINYIRMVKHWHKKKSVHEWEPRVFYKPLLFGLTKCALRNTSFLSAASFQETSRVLSRAALSGRIDFLLGLKENLILGTRLPIGTNSRFFTGKSAVARNFEPKISIKTRYFTRTKDKIIKRKRIFIWIDALCYLDIGHNSHMREE
jgi:hypothetical protein